MVAAIYARVSTDEQCTDLQLNALREYVARRGWESVEYVDEGISGAKLSRPRLNELLKDAHRKKFGAVIVWKLDRFARSTMFLSSTLKDFQALGVDFISLTESMDTTTPSGRLLFHVMSSIAEFERDLIKERIGAGITAARKRGVRLGRIPKLSTEQRVQIMQLHAQGMPHRAITEQLGGKVSRATVLRAITQGKEKAEVTE